MRILLPSSHRRFCFDDTCIFSTIKLATVELREAAIDEGATRWLTYRRLLLLGCTTDELACSGWCVGRRRRRPSLEHLIDLFELVFDLALKVLHSIYDCSFLLLAFLPGWWEVSLLVSWGCGARCLTHGC